MAAQVTVYKYDPLTHRFSDDLSTKGSECFAVLRNPTTNKTEMSADEILKNVELYCPSTAAAPMPEIHNKIEPHIVINNGFTSYKKMGLLFLAGTVAGAISLKFGYSIASSLASRLIFSTGVRTAISGALGIISSVGSYLGYFIRLGQATPSSTNTTPNITAANAEAGQFEKHANTGNPVSFPTFKHLNIVFSLAKLFIAYGLSTAQIPGIKMF